MCTKRIGQLFLKILCEVLWHQRSQIFEDKGVFRKLNEGYNSMITEGEKIFT